MNRLYIGALCAALMGGGAVQAATPAPMTATQAQQQNAAATAQNQLIMQLSQAQAAKDWPKAESLLRQLTAMDPAHWQYRQALGDAQMNQGKYPDALKNYESALAQAGKDKAGPETRQAMAQMYGRQGNALIKLQRNEDAVAAYTHSAELSDKPGLAWFNVCAVEYNLGLTEAALPACDKAIAAEPGRADAWFIKGSLLMGNASAGADGKMVPPPGTVEALKKYLELAPQGPHADDVKQMLEFLQAKP